ncbi:MAG: ABC transporter substrate-binding protein [Lachnospirales bacterium]
MKKLLAATLSIILSMTTLIGCTEKNEANSSSSTKVEDVSNNDEELPILKVGVLPFLNSIPVKYMVDNGLDTANGFKIETVFFPTGGPMNEALASNLWDVGTLSAASVYSLATYGAYVVADIGHAEGGIETLVNSDSPIASVKGYNPTYPEILGDPDTVRGATIAVPTGTLSQLNVFKWLEKIELDPSEVSIVHMDFAQAYQALLAKQCDVAALNPPTSYTAEDKGMAVTSSLVSLDIPLYDSIIASKDAHENKKELLVKYTKAFFEATNALQANPAMAEQLLMDWYKENGSDITPETCKMEISTRPFVTSEEAKGITVGDSVKITAEFYASQGLIEVDKLNIVNDHVQDDVVKEALGY